jgi:hypothetical protein
VFTSSLHRNGSSSIVACVFISAETCLPSSCLAMNYLGFQASCHIILFHLILSTYFFLFHLNLPLHSPNTFSHLPFLLCLLKFCQLLLYHSQSARMCAQFCADENLSREFDGFTVYESP